MHHAGGLRPRCRHACCTYQWTFVSTCPTACHWWSVGNPAPYRAVEGVGAWSPGTWVGPRPPGPVVQGRMASRAPGADGGWPPSWTVSRGCRWAESCEGPHCLHHRRARSVGQPPGLVSCRHGWSHKHKRLKLFISHKCNFCWLV